VNQHNGKNVAAFFKLLNEWSRAEEAAFAVWQTIANL